MTNAHLALLVAAREAVTNGRGVAIRRAAGLSQGELARAAGVSAASVSRWEAGVRLPTGEAALKYARILRVLETVT
jgi:DNA-binding transcriptional regulator YiaG